MTTVPVGTISNNGIGSFLSVTQRNHANIYQWENQLEHWDDSNQPSGYSQGTLPASKCMGIICKTWTGYSRSLKTCCGLSGLPGCVTCTVSWYREKVRSWELAVSWVESPHCSNDFLSAVNINSMMNQRWFSNEMALLLDTVHIMCAVWNHLARYHKLSNLTAKLKQQRFPHQYNFL